MDSLSGWQHSVGNQHLLDLLSSPRVQLKSRSASADPLEAEADRAAELVSQRIQSPQIQRKCAGGDSCHCKACSADDDLRRMQLSSASSRVQRQVRDQDSARQAETQESAGTKSPAAGFLVEDDTTALRSGQMQKTAFLTEVNGLLSNLATAELSALGRPETGGPRVAEWMAQYREQSAVSIERSLWKLAPEANSAGSAKEYFSIIRRRARQVVSTWARNGKIPAELPALPTRSANETAARRESAENNTSAAKKAKEGFGTTLLRTLTGENKVQFKEQPGTRPTAADPQAVRGELGSGQGLDSRSRARMENAFGQDFSRVRIHTDSRAETLSAQLNARAFTVGTDIAFAPGEYRPGTLFGDALLAHELAHVVQQGNGRSKSNRGSTSSLERDADISAQAFVVGTFQSMAGKKENQKPAEKPKLQTGLRIQRCGGNDKAKDASGPAPADKDAANVPTTPASNLSSGATETPKHLDYVLAGLTKTRWRVSYKSERETHEPLERLKRLRIKTEPAIQDKKQWTFDYYPLTKEEAEAEAKAKQTDLGKWYTLNPVFDNQAKSYYLEVRTKCPEGVPSKAGYRVWKTCLPQAQAKALVARIKAKKIEALDPVPTESINADPSTQQFTVYFKPLETEKAAIKAGEESVKDVPGSAEGMFKFSASRDEDVDSFVYEMKVVCPDGYDKLTGGFHVTSYVVAKETEFSSGPQEEACGLKGKFPHTFLQKTKLEGTGKTAGGKYIQYDKEESKKRKKDCYRPSNCPEVAFGNKKCAQPNHTVAVKTSDIPFGTELFIEGVGKRVAEDVGDMINNNHIDVYQPESMSSSDAEKMTYDDILGKPNGLTVCKKK